MEELKGLLKDFTQMVGTKLDDHDLLIELRTVQKGMADQVQALVTGTTATIREHERQLQSALALAAVVEDHEKRLRFSEKVLYYGGGVAASAYAAVKILGGHF